MAFRRIDTDFSSIPDGGPAARWGKGVVGAALVAICALAFIVTSEGWASGGSILFGVAIAWLALLLHFRYFWGLNDRLCHYCGILQTVALIGFGGTLALWALAGWAGFL